MRNDEKKKVRGRLKVRLWREKKEIARFDETSNERSRKIRRLFLFISYNFFFLHKGFEVHFVGCVQQLKKWIGKFLLHLVVIITPSSLTLFHSRISADQLWIYSPVHEIDGEKRNHPVPIPLPAPRGNTFHETGHFSSPVSQFLLDVFVRQAFLNVQFFFSNEGRSYFSIFLSIC